MSTIDLAEQGVKPRTIRIVRTEPETSGTRNGRAWTRYRVFAQEVDGTEITEVLKTFDALPLGEVEVAQKAYVKNGVIESYTVTPTVQKRANGQKTALERRVEQLESEVAELRSLFNAAIRGLEAE